MLLNIVSLIDIFTVLVFFLLLNATELQLLPEAPNIRLPESVAQTPAQETVVVMIGREQILVQGQPVANVPEVLRSSEPTIAALRTALQNQPKLPAEGQGTGPRALTVMGDRDISYTLLRKVLATCAETDFSNLSLAVLQKATPPQALRGGPAT